MRPVRFVALSEDGQALVLADEVGRLLALPIDDRVARCAATPERSASHGSSPWPPTDPPPSLSPAGHPGPHPVRRVRRGRGPHRGRAGRPGAALRRPGAAGAGDARPARPPYQAQDLRHRAPRSAEVVDGRLAQHGIDTEKISWDAYRRDDGTWRIVATWPSGKATAQAVWELDKARQHGPPHDDMAQYLCAERPTADPRPGPPERRTRATGAPRPRGTARAPNRPRAATGCPTRGRPASAGRPRPDPGRPRRAARLARPSAGLAAGRAAATTGAGAGAPPPVERRPRRRLGGGAARLRRRPDAPKEIPAVPSLAVLRPRRTAGGRRASRPPTGDKPRKRLPSWDDVLFGGGSGGPRDLNVLSLPRPRIGWGAWSTRIWAAPACR